MTVPPSDAAIPIPADPASLAAWAAHCQANGVFDQAAMLWRHLGQVQAAAGDPVAAAAAFEALLQLAPQDVDGHFNLAVCRHHTAPEAAAAGYRTVLALNPDHGEAAFNLALLHQGQGRALPAIAAYERAVALRPDLVDAALNLASLLRDTGQSERAAAVMAALTARHPDLPAGWFLLGLAQTDRGLFAEADQALRQALALAPDFVEALAARGSMLIESGGAAEALACFDAAVALRPSDADLHASRGEILRVAGQPAAAIAAFDHALALDPGQAPARFGRCLATLPLMSADCAAEEAARADYAAALAALCVYYAEASPAEKVLAAQASFNFRPFILAYQGRDDRALQERYGRLVCDLMQAAFPDAAPGVTLPAPADEPIRVGFVSGFLRYHSNWKIPIKGWVDGLPRDRFQLFAYHTSARQDAETEAARSRFDRFHQAPMPFEQWIATIRADRPHLLIYPEIGMDPVASRLAALRLAPVQATSWGHPTTSGYPTIDYFLSSDAMEPPDGADHYSERLIRLPHLSIHYRPPVAAPTPPPLPVLPSGSVLCLCVQYLPKYRPDGDILLARIAGAAPEARLVFLGLPLDQAMPFRDRLAGVFAGQGLRFDDHALMLPPLDPGAYAGLLQRADLFLDSLDWSGCNSALEALGFGVPLVTLPGRLMRGRHSAAILQRMGLGDLVAGDVEGYVARAVGLIRDPALRAGERARILAALPSLWDDPEPTKALSERVIKWINKMD